MEHASDISTVCFSAPEVRSELANLVLIKVKLLKIDIVQIT